MFLLSCSRLTLLLVTLGLVSFTAWRLLQIPDYRHLPGVILDSSDNYLHDRPNKQSQDAAYQDDLEKDLTAGNGVAPPARIVGDQRIFVTVTEIKMMTKTEAAAGSVTPIMATRLDGDRSTSTATSTINRNFERYAGLVEDYKLKISPEQQVILDGMKFESTRQARVKRLYQLDGAEDWRKFIADQDDSAMPPLTKFTQEYIYKWQHPDPSECSKKQFLVIPHYWDNNGLGTVVHATGWILGLAMRHNRILVYQDSKAPGQNFVEPDCKTGPSTRSLDCIFESFSSCSTQNIRPDNNITLFNYWQIPAELNISTSAIPPIFGQALKNGFPDMHEDAIKYWWRTQAAAYMMRMNGPALKRLYQMRIDPGMHIAVTHNTRGELVNTTVPFPLHDGSFSMHVRHGDKGIEMELIPFSAYVKKAEEYAAMNMIMARKECFISTEDVKVIEEAKETANAWISPNTTSNQNWTWIWSDIPRINGGPKEQLNKFGNRTDMTIKWMQQLFFAIEAPNILGTRGSGWNRMIDELRCVWIDCRTPYMEVGPFEDWVHYNF